MANVFRQFLRDVEHGDFHIIPRHIGNGIDLETRDEDEQTALILAARCNHFECVKVLIAAHANVNAKDVDEWTPLLNACHVGNLDIVQILAENGAELDQHDCGGFTPLMWASYQGHLHIVKYLLTRGVNVDAVDEHGITSLGWASGRNHVEIVITLLEAGAMINLCDKNNTSPLMWASRRGYTDVVTQLMRYNPNINIIGMKNMNALLMATKGGHNETALHLLENRTIDIKIQDKDGQTSLSYACLHGMRETVAELLKRHAYVNTVDKNGDPVLFAAVKGGDEDCLALVLESHGDVNAIGAENKTAIWWAVERGRLNIVKHLLQYNPDIEVAGGSDEDTPLLLASKRKRVGIVYELIKQGAKLSSVDRFGDNSLHIALRNRSRDIVDILLSNPRHAKYLYRPNKCGETPYKIDSNLQKSILTTIFGQRTLNLNDDSILGYDLYSSALAEILTEPSLQTPITVGLFAKWGSGKSALLTHLKNEMRSFAQLTDFPALKMSLLLVSIILVFGLLIGSVGGCLIHYIFGITSGTGTIVALFAFLLFVQYLIRNKDYEWTALVAHFIKKRLDFIRFLLQVIFMNPYASVQSKTTDCRKMKFIFTEYGKVSTTEGEKAIAGMIADLAGNIEDSFGILATRLCRALHSKNLSRHRFRHICCIPAFIFVTFQIVLFITFLCLVRIYGIPTEKSNAKTFYFTLAVLFGISVLCSLKLWLRLLLALLKSPKSKIMKITEYALRNNESSIYQLKKEVNQISHIIKTVEVFLNVNTRLVVLIDGLDVCEQQRIIQILDQVHVLLTKDDDPFITLIVCDPHKMMQDMNTIVSNKNNFHGQSSVFDTSVNGHDYLRSIIQLPVYLQLDLNKTKHITVNDDGFRKRRNTTISTGASTLDVSTKSVGINQMSKKKRRRQRRDTLPNTKPVTTSELTHQLFQSDYFSDIDPRIFQRLINVIGMTGRLLRAHQVLFSWKRLGCWSYLVEQWPYRMSWIVVHYEDNEYNYPEETSLKDIYKKIRKFATMCNDSFLKLDHSERKLELCMEHGEPTLNLADLKLFLLCTCNLDPYLNKLIRESNGYMFMNSGEQNQLGEPDLMRDFGRSKFIDQKRLEMVQSDALVRKKGLSDYSNLPEENCRQQTSQNFLKRNEEDHCIHPQTSSVNSMTQNTVKPVTEEKPPRILNRPPDVKIDLTTSLTEMAIDDVCEALKNEIMGLKQSMITTYVNDISENNISGLVLAVCDLEELRKTMSMTFGDWVIFSNWVRSKREQDSQSQVNRMNPNESNLSRNSMNFDNHFRNSFDRTFNDRPQTSYLNADNEVYAVTENDLKLLSGSKTVKFLIPLSRSGLTSNESTIGINELENRFIPDVRDLFSNPPLTNGFSSNDNGTTSQSLSPIAEQISTISDSPIVSDEFEANENDHEKLPLLNRRSSNN